MADETDASLVFNGREYSMSGKGTTVISELQSELSLKFSSSSMKNLPTEFGLSQNYPNPFNPSTVIRYQIPVGRFAESSERLGESFYTVSLKVYNILGEEMATLVDGLQSAGYRLVEWDASSFPSGVYFYRFTAGDYTDIKKMLLTK